MAMLQTDTLTIGYRPHRRPAHIVSEKLDLTLEAGQLICLLGPNGAGKSTLMRTLAGMQPPLGGRVRLGGDDIASLPSRTVAKRLSIVLTERIDAGLLSAYALVALGRYPYTDWRGRLTAADETIVQNAIDAVGARPLAHRPVSQLSDGERQKIMIARALAQQPDVILLDEPTAYLDLPRRVEIMQILRRLAHDDGRAILLSTHDLHLAMRSADAIWLLANGKLHIGAPEDLVLNGAFAAAFAGEGVTFDPMSGSFHVAHAHRGSIAVVGDGVRAVWTARALERVGFQVDAAAPLRVICHPTTWEYGTAEYRSLAHLTKHL